MDGGWLAVWPVAAFFLGGLATQLTGWLTHRRQQLERRQDATAALKERRENFELDQLQKLYEALQVLGRSVSQAHSADMMASRESRRYASSQLGNELAEGLRLANRDVRLLSGLVLDDGLRGQVRDAQSAMNVPSTMLGVDPSEAEAAFRVGVEILDETQQRVAARIREIYPAATSD